MSASQVEPGGFRRVDDALLDWDAAPPEEAEEEVTPPREEPPPPVEPMGLMDWEPPSPVQRFAMEEEEEEVPPPGEEPPPPIEPMGLMDWEPPAQHLAMAEEPEPVSFPTSLALEEISPLQERNRDTLAWDLDQPAPPIMEEEEEPQPLPSQPTPEPLPEPPPSKAWVAPEVMAEPSLRQIHLEGVSRMAEKLGITWLPLPHYEIGTETGSFVTALPAFLAHAKVQDSVSPPGVRLGFRSRSLAMILAGWMIVSSLGLLAAAWWLDDAAETLEIQNIQWKNRLKAMTLPKLEEAPNSGKEVIPFLMELDQIRKITPLKEVIRELGQTPGSAMRVELLRVDRPGNHYRVHLEGRFETGFRQAQAEWNDFLNRVNRMGYQVLEHDFSTTIGASTFRAVLDRK